MPTLYGTCPKCKTSYKLKSNYDTIGVICPNCKKKGVTMPGVIHLKPKEPVLRKAAEALLKYIKEDNVRGLSDDHGDGHTWQYRDEEFEAHVDKLREALE